MTALLIALAALAMLAYMAPVIIAARRAHPWAWSILVLTLFGGWTFLAWVAALAWSLGPVLVEAEPEEAAAELPAGRAAGRNVVVLDDFRPGA